MTFARNGGLQNSLLFFILKNIILWIYVYQKKFLWYINPSELFPHDHVKLCCQMYQN